MKTLKKFGQFINESTKPEIDLIMDEFMEEYYPGDEYDYEIVSYGNGDDMAEINVFHTNLYAKDSSGNEPGEEFKDQIAADNEDAAKALINMLNSKGYGDWEYAPPTYRGFTIVQLYDPRTPPSNRKPSRYHTESVKEGVDNPKEYEPIPLILDAVCESPGSKFEYRWTVSVNKVNKYDSILKVQEQFPSGWQLTPGQWYVGTLLGKDGYMGNSTIHDMIYIDYGQKWFVIGLQEALKEVKFKLNIE